MRTNKPSNLQTITTEELGQYKLLYPLLFSLLDEMKELSKKKQDGALNAMKVKLANRLLTKVKTLLSKEPTDEFLDLLDEQNLPTNSDAVLIISQFKTALDSYRVKYYTYKIGKGESWNIEGGQEEYDGLEDTPF